MARVYAFMIAPIPLIPFPEREGEEYLEGEAL
jgi:hypothetical protein